MEHASRGGVDSLLGARRTSDAALRGGVGEWLRSDLAAPLPYAPEFYRNEFKSKVADMKNSVKDRGNAQASCAANFIGEHLHKEYEGGWLHCDIAGPASIEERGTGFGVALVLGILEVEGFAA